MRSELAKAGIGCMSLGSEISFFLTGKDTHDPGCQTESMQKEDEMKIKKVTVEMELENGARVKLEFDNPTSIAFLSNDERTLKEAIEMWRQNLSEAST